MNTTRRYHKKKKKSLLGRMPAWSWWLGGFLVVVVYIAAFYYFFISPYSFRWRAIYGEADYPEGYEIHGLDISIKDESTGKTFKRQQYKDIPCGL